MQRCYYNKDDKSGKSMVGEKILSRKWNVRPTTKSLGCVSDAWVCFVFRGGCTSITHARNHVYLYFWKQKTNSRFLQGWFIQVGPRLKTRSTLFFCQRVWRHHRERFVFNVEMYWHLYWPSLALNSSTWASSDQLTSHCIKSKQKCKVLWIILQLQIAL